MASTSTWILSLKVLFISTGVLSIALGLKVSVPLVLDFSVSQAPVFWSSFSSWLKPPYLYVIINGIIIIIVASSRFHKNHAESEEDQTTEQMPLPRIPVDPQPPFEYEEKSRISRSDFDVVDSSAVVYGQKQSEEEVYASVVEEEVEEKNVVVENGDRYDEFVISKSWTPPKRMDSSEILQEIPLENLLPAEKPLVSVRFGHRKPVKASPEGGRSLRVAKPKRHETMENTWKMITEGRAMPLSRHLKKSDTWENYGRQVNVDALADPSAMKTSETFKDRTNYESPPLPPLSSTAQVTSSPSPAKLRKEPSLSQDELNRRVEAFIKKFNEEMRLQRQESLNQYKEMINRGSQC